MRSVIPLAWASLHQTPSILAPALQPVDNNRSVLVTKTWCHGAKSGAIGDPTTITGNGSYSVGNDNTISVNNSFAYGSNISITAAANTINGNVVLGNNSADEAYAQITSGTVGGVTYGSFAGTAKGVVSVGAAGNERQIVNVAPGEISATSTDAINGSQLYFGLSTTQSTVASLSTVASTSFSTTKSAVASFLLCQAVRSHHCQL